MGDRCSVHISCLNAHSADICKILGEEPSDVELHGGDILRADMEFLECAEGMSAERRAAALARHIFYGWHDAGEHYPATMFASIGDGFLYEVLAVDMRGEEGAIVQVLVVNDGGNLVGYDLMTKFLSVYDMARKFCVGDLNHDNILPQSKTTKEHA